jgi:hypothetical protein
MNKTQQKFAKAFAEWDRRYRGNPSDFTNTVDHLLRGNPTSYGESCALYFTSLLKDVTPKRKARKK